MKALAGFGIAGVLILAGVALLSSSSKPVPSGKFRGRSSIAAQPGADPVVVDQLALVELTISPDGRSLLLKGGVPYEGRMTRSGDTLSFEVLSVANININKQDPSLPRRFAFDIRSDGSLSFEGLALRPSGSE